MINQLYITHFDIPSSIMSTVSAVIGMIPEGLVLLTSSAMAVSVIRLRRYNVLVQELYSIENLARVDVICFDKTGTITEGEMEPTYTYRSTEATVSRKNPNGSINIFWRGAQAKDVNKFMSDFLNIYKQGGASLIYSNPFLASSIIHLLFLRIHPYTDGNGRTARILHNIKFTEMINKLYGTRLKLSPLNISESILINKITYVKRIDNIYFDTKHDSNIEINAWFNFILDMIDEQLYKSMNKLQEIDSSLIKEIPKSDMRLSRLKHR